MHVLPVGVHSVKIVYQPPDSSPCSQNPSTSCHVHWQVCSTCSNDDSVAGGQDHIEGAFGAPQTNLSQGQGARGDAAVCSVKTRCESMA